MPTPVRVVLVGCGWFACVAHIPALKRLEGEGRIKLVGLCSRSEASTKRASGLYGRQDLKHYLSLEDVAQDPDVDLVDLTLPIEVMPGAIKLFLSAGKHVISEKPGAPSVATGIELMEHHARLDRPVVWAVAENWRFKKTTQMVEDIVASGALGEIRFADFTYLSFQKPDNLRWRGSPGYAGGYMLDSGVHFIALLRKIVGEVEEVSASVSQRVPYLPPADSATAILSFASGAEGAYRLTFAAPYSAGDQGLRLTGSKGMLLAGFNRFSPRDFRHNWIRVQTSGRKRFVPVMDDLFVPGGVYETLSHCIEAVQQGAPLVSSPAQALRDVAVVEAMLESSRLKRPVKPAALPPLAHAPLVQGRTQTLKAYGDFLSYRPRTVVECASVEDVSNAVVAAGRSGHKVRAFGNGYSQGPEIIVDDVAIRLSGLNRVRRLDPVTSRVIVEGGVRIGDLTRLLAGSGLSLPSLPFLTECSIGAAVATATHGTSPRWGTVSDFVQSMTVVLPSGEVKTIDSTSTPEERRAANVAVGWLGIIVEVELQAMAMPWVRFEELSMTIDEFLARMPNLAERYEHMWGHWSLGADTAVLRCLETSVEPQKGFRPYVSGNGPYWGDENLKSTGVRRAKAALRRIANYHPALKRAAKSVRGERPQEVGVTMQYSVGASQAPLAIERLRTSDFAKLNPGRVVEMKFLKASEQSYLGPNSGQDAVLFNTYWFVDEAVKLTVFDLFEDVMTRLGGRPHWGKLHKRQDIEYLRRVYPEWDKFETVRAKFDPDQIFDPPNRQSHVEAAS
ncbi:MAG TPA: FAD-binding protein [Roseiarcus sp.]|jgi:predicted dehydrogenase/FAD/FMN-containing dehydrogenase|nr:FAD-binding protein [Roseiarcus sp.]